MMKTTHEGIFAAALTPFDSDGSVAVDRVPAMVEYYLSQGVQGLYVCGSTGEGPSLSSSERRELAEAFLGAARDKMTVIVQVGHNSVTEARLLANHAEAHGADAISASCPSYFGVESLAMLVETSAYVAAGAPKTPFYYYHIPSLTGVNYSMSEFLACAESKIDNLAGMKFTAPVLDQFQLCLQWRKGEGTFFWGVDEVMYSALAVGAKGAIGSTYNVVTPLFQKIVTAFGDGEPATAEALQFRAVQFIEVLKSYPFISALKTIITRLGIPMGGSRLPNRSVSEEETERFLSQVDELSVLE